MAAIPGNASSLTRTLLSLPYSVLLLGPVHAPDLHVVSPLMLSATSTPPRLAPGHRSINYLSVCCSAFLAWRRRHLYSSAARAVRCRRRRAHPTWQQRPFRSRWHDALQTGFAILLKFADEPATCGASTSWALALQLSFQHLQPCYPSPADAGPHGFGFAYWDYP